MFTRDNGILPDCPQTVLCDTICDISIEDCDMIRAMKQMNSNSAPDPDSIHPKFINNIYPFFHQGIETDLQSVSKCRCCTKYLENLRSHSYMQKQQQAKQLCFLLPSLSNELYKQNTGETNPLQAACIPKGV